jgi:hypothetical protein
MNSGKLGRLALTRCVGLSAVSIPDAGFPALEAFDQDRTRDQRFPDFVKVIELIVTPNLVTQ